jgi:hypothetical protein
LSVLAALRAQLAVSGTTLNPNSNRFVNQGG